MVQNLCKQFLSIISGERLGPCCTPGWRVVIMDILDKIAKASHRVWPFCKPNILCARSTKGGGVVKSISGHKPQPYCTKSMLTKLGRRTKLTKKRRYLVVGLAVDDRAIYEDIGGM